MAAEESAPKPEETAAPKGRKGLIIVAAAVLVAEGVGVFLLTRALGAAPATAVAASQEGAGDAHAESGKTGAAEGEHGKSAESAQDELVELELGECRPSNKMTGKNILFQLRVSILVGGSDQERAKKLVEAKQARIRDRINFVIRSAEPTYLNEPGLETIKRRIKHELDRVFDDNEIIREVLIPELLQSGSGL